MSKVKIRKITAGILAAGLTLSTLSTSAIMVYGNAANEVQDMETDSYINSVISTAEEEFSLLQTYYQNASDINIKNSEVTGLGGNRSFDGKNLSIMKAGAYRLSGELEGQISVSSSKKSEVVLILDGIKVSNPSGPALKVKKTGSLIIYVNEGTVNEFTSGEKTDIDENSKSIKNELSAENPETDISSAAIWLKSDTLIMGGGELQVGGYLNNGIEVSKVLTLMDTDLKLRSVNNGIRGKEIINILSGNIDILSGGDSIKAERDEEAAAEAAFDETTGEIIEAYEGKPASGYVNISGGCINIDSYRDGISALKGINVYGGEINIKTEGTYDNSQSRGDSPGAASGKSNKNSEKGLKSEGFLNINGGVITINSVDDGLHSGGILKITGGDINVNTGDDGLHSDKQIDIYSGFVKINDSYEGIEASVINVYGGDIQVNAGDDGFNCGGDADSSGSPEGPGNSPGNPGVRVQEAAEDAIVTAENETAQDEKTEDSTGEKVSPLLNIEGGNIYVNSRGDGLDSNKDIRISGGFIIVDGPSDSGNGALDCGSENGGNILISGGTVAALGASGMAETFEESSEQCSFKCNLGKSYSQGTEITVSDLTGKVLFAHTAVKSGNSIVFSCPELKKGDSCILEVGSTKYMIDLTSVSTVVTGDAEGNITAGSSGAAGGNPMPQPPGGDSQGFQPPKGDSRGFQPPEGDSQQTGSEEEDG